ncbi:RNA recognition motif domain-containing protein [Hirsutella rhossiliensis]|uniref:RNA recognition motif domain-containing protein n=1 Tax=Hirsutella rhossiliensis TaxID=111463 RepID=A0A9P8SCG2_9HYPO|nr:RNA recognition motif domain-containing protein [Hirsutella rhossiliensis]KAH0957603.1 RNA recognition motif domain-containing protein [Hirsutella rhossiliensis]
MESAPQSQPDALSAGRRIYLGNLLYSVKPYNIEEALAANGFGDFEKIHISVDPVSARNPGYCFVDFPDSDAAQRALSSLNVAISGRPVKVGPCEPKKQRNRPSDRGDRFAFERWGDWGASKGVEQGPRGALNHFDDMVEDGHEGRRLYVGGLGKMIDQAQNNREISELFAHFNPIAIGKRITPHEATRSKPGNHHYCFVDFETKAETRAAIQALNGKPIPGGRLKVALAGKIPQKLMERHTDARYGRRAYNTSPEEDSGRQGEGAAQAGSRAMASRDWRRKRDEAE